MESRTHSRIISEVHELSQFFVKRDNKDFNFLTIAKVVVDFLVVCNHLEMVSFRDSISRRFTVRQFAIGNAFIFDLLHNTRDSNDPIQIKMQETF